jgi:hypothetical protein
MLFLFSMILYSHQPPMSSNNTPTTTAFLRGKIIRIIIIS